MQNLTISSTYNNTNILDTINLAGKLMAMDAITFKSQLLDIISNQEENFKIDIHNLESIDITGINALTIAHKEMKTRSLKLTIVGPKNGPAQELLDLTKFSSYLNLQLT